MKIVSTDKFTPPRDGSVDVPFSKLPGILNRFRNREISFFDSGFQNVATLVGIAMSGDTIEIEVTNWRRRKRFTDDQMLLFKDRDILCVASTLVVRISETNPGKFYIALRNANHITFG